VPPRFGARRALGPDHVLAVRADGHPDLTPVLDVEERGVADAPPAGVEPVERVGDLIALVELTIPGHMRRGPWLAPGAIGEDGRRFAQSIASIRPGGAVNSPGQCDAMSEIFFRLLSRN
jgi:hypothetical protein